MGDSARINSEGKHSVMLNAVCNEPVSLKVLEEPFYRKGFSPFVNKETGTWWEYDDDKKGFFDTGIIAQGRDGNDYVITEQDYDTIVERTLNNVNPTLDEKLSSKLPKSPANWEPWTAEEQASARERMSVENGSDFELLVDATLEEEANSFVVKFPKPVRECLYHVWFFNNNVDKARLYTECFDFDTKFDILLKYSLVSNNCTCAIEGYFKHNGNLPNKSVNGIANETITDLWVSDSYANGSYAWAPYTYSKGLNKVDAMKIYLADKLQVLNVGAVIRVWGR